MSQKPTLTAEQELYIDVLQDTISDVQQGRFPGAIGVWIESVDNRILHAFERAGRKLADVAIPQGSEGSADN